MCLAELEKHRERVDLHPREAHRHRGAIEMPEHVPRGHALRQSLKGLGLLGRSVEGRGHASEPRVSAGLVRARIRAGVAHPDHLRFCRHYANPPPFYFLLSITHGIREKSFSVTYFLISPPGGAPFGGPPF